MAELRPKLNISNGFARGAIAQSGFPWRRSDRIKAEKICAQKMELKPIRLIPHQRDWA